MSRPAAKQSADTGAETPLVNLRKQAKFAILGGLGVWYWQVSLHLGDALSGTGWSRCVSPFESVTSCNGCFANA